MISLNVDFVNIFNNTAIIYIHIAILNCTYMIHRPTKTNCLRLFFILAKVPTTLLKSKYSESSFSIYSTDKSDNRISSIVECVQLFICFSLLRLHSVDGVLTGKTLYVP